MPEGNYYLLSIVHRQVFQFVSSRMMNSYGLYEISTILYFVLLR